MELKMIMKKQLWNKLQAENGDAYTQFNRIISVVGFENITKKP